MIVRKYKSRSFGFASRNFYTALLAAVDVDKDPERYFGVLDRHAPDNSRVLVLPEYIAVGTLAKSLGVGRDALEPINLSLKPTVWNGTKKVPKGYEFRVPSGGGRSATVVGVVVARRVGFEADSGSVPRRATRRNVVVDCAAVRRACIGTGHDQ